MTRANAIAGALFASVLLAGAAGAQDTSESPSLGANAAPKATKAEPVATTGATPTSPAAQDMVLPKIMAATVDWKAARDVLAQLPAAQAAPKSTDDNALLAQINAATNATYKGIAASSVPVLLPVNADALLRSKISAPADSPPAPEGDAANFKLNFFLAGPAGYDAAFMLSGAVADEVKNFGKKEDPVILISGFAMLYDLDPPVAPLATSAKDLDVQYPGIRRRLLESYVRYSFQKFGVSYTASMLCFEGRAHARWVTCREADAILLRFIKTLQLAGGMPQPISPSPPNTIDRPVAQSPDFTFAAPGRLIENTGLKGFDGRPQWTVYAKIRFPLNAPAYANSQSFLNWGNCDFTGRVPYTQTKGTPYHCKVNTKPLVFDESVAENRSYPWRDNFCEHRRFFVGQCPSGEGHQGQDIRPTTCQLHNDGADRCDPFKDDVLAVRNGTILRVPKRESLYLLVNAPGEHVRFRYLHMHPDMLDASGLVSGREVKEGEVIGKVGNFDRVPNGTTYHLHFEIQVPTRDGWVFVSPYATLISAYERLIGGRGRMFAEPEAVPAPPPEAPTVASAPAKTAEPAKPPVKIAEKTEKVEKPAKESKSKAQLRKAERDARRGAKKEARHAVKSSGRHHAAKRPEVQSVAADALPDKRAINPHTVETAKAEEVKAKETPGEKKASRKLRRAEAPCKAEVSAGSGERACGPRAARRRTSANGV